MTTNEPKNELRNVSDSKLVELVTDWKRVQYEASLLRRTSGMRNSERELRKLWAEQDRRAGR